VGFWFLFFLKNINNPMPIVKTFFFQGKTDEIIDDIRFFELAQSVQVGIFVKYLGYFAKTLVFFLFANVFRVKKRYGNVLLLAQHIKQILLYLQVYPCEKQNNDIDSVFDALKELVSERISKKLDS
jgi:hypothetical protein